MSKQEAINQLKSAIKCAAKENDKRPIVYTQLLNVSRSGMYRNIAIYIVDMKNEPKGLLWNISALVADSLERKLKTVNGTYCVGVSGCGMDMGFEVVSTLSYLLTDWKDYGTLSHRWL